MNEPRAVIETDAVVVGAGPIGLFQVFELGLLEVRCQVVDSLPYPGGQCIELYPDKPIYDIPAVPVCTGRELTERLLGQIEPFAPTFHLGQEVVRVERQADQRFAVQTSHGTQFVTTALIVAGGVGGFRPRTLRIEGLDRHEGTQLFHRLPDPALLAGRRLVIAGDGDAAIDAALQFTAAGPGQAAAVTLIHRRDSFRAEPANVERMRALCAGRQMRFIAGQITGFEESSARLTAVQVADGDGAVHRVAADVLLVFLGLSPKLGPIADWGLDIDRKQVVVDTAQFQTSVPGIHAVGDINTYPGKKKLIVCGFHEATLAAYAVAGRVFPHRQTALQYTTTSPRLHRLLGVDSPVLDSEGRGAAV